jgi:lipopolysaccharide biosynthesis glycosyltransferase
MLSSVCSHHRGPVRVELLHGEDLLARRRAELARMVEREGGAIAFHRIEAERVAGLKTLSFMPPPHWYRIFLPQLLPDVDRILYLDVDTIAVDALEPLWEIDLGENALAAVTNVFQADHGGHLEALGLSGGPPYFNSGVMLLSLEAMRDVNATEQLRSWALAHHDLLTFPEQDAMNAVLGERRLALHPRWNLMNSILLFPWAAEVFGERTLGEAIERPAIRHFEGPGANKPWHVLCERPGRDTYREHRRRTPWPRVRPEGLTPGNLVRRLRIAARRSRPPDRGPRPPDSMPAR